MKKSRRNTRSPKRVKRVKTESISLKSLKQLVLEEVAKLSGELEDIEKVSAEEVDADGYAETLESDIDMYKAMQIKEAKLRRQHRKIVKEARRIRHNKQLAKKKILRNLK